ncbi:hypothetical protein TrLO_g10660 [Triparma laevis f. longispina]|uniref:Sulfotransferase n=1 Tax=Triparma laevis f. longispina TaxID=1714387 RepID=A0A9W7E895_9STRA|nr:hypothetical protein TrLO_g10660 [Triparma laevis f. longispina]
MFSFKAFDDANGVHQTNHRLKGAARNTIVPKPSPTNLSSPSPPNLFFPSSAYQSFNAMHCRSPPEPYSESDDVFEVKKLGTHCTRSELHGCLSSRRASIFGESDVEQTLSNGTPVEIKYVTLIRDPIDRVLSEYYWGREHGLSQPEKARKKEMEKETGINSNQQFSQQHQQKSSKKPSNKLRNKKRTREPIPKWGDWSENMMAAAIVNSTDSFSRWIHHPDNKANNRMVRWLLDSSVPPQTCTAFDGHSHLSLEPFYYKQTTTPNRAALSSLVDSFSCIGLVEQLPLSVTHCQTALNLPPPHPDQPKILDEIMGNERTSHKSSRKSRAGVDEEVVMRNMVRELNELDVIFHDIVKTRFDAQYNIQ